MNFDKDRVDETILALLRLTMFPSVFQKAVTRDNCFLKPRSGNQLV